MSRQTTKPMSKDHERVASSKPCLFVRKDRCDQRVALTSVKISDFSLEGSETKIDEGKNVYYDFDNEGAVSFTLTSMSFNEDVLNVMYKGRMSSTEYTNQSSSEKVIVYAGEWTNENGCQGQCYRLPNHYDSVTISIKYLGSNVDVASTDYQVGQAEGFHFIKFTGTGLDKGNGLEITVNGTTKKSYTRKYEDCQLSNPFIVELVTYGCDKKGKFEKTMSFYWTTAKPLTYVSADGENREMYTIGVYADTSIENVVYL